MAAQTARVMLIAVILGASTGCARTGITLLPNEKSSAGAVALLDPKTGKDLALLDHANASFGVTAGPRKSKVTDLSDAAVGKRYDQLLADLPEQPKIYLLYFREGSTDLVDESNALLPEVLGEMKRRPGAEIQIVGHTDTVGETAANDELSIKRAQQVEALFLSMGIARDVVRATGRGEREPLEPTGENVASFFNRRVEVYVK